jgi:hypothetical protein
MIKLNENMEIENAIVDALFPNLNPTDQRKIVKLLRHATEHPWMDEELSLSILENIYNENDLEFPKDELGVFSK